MRQAKRHPLKNHYIDQTPLTYDNMHITEPGFVAIAWDMLKDCNLPEPPLFVKTDWMATGERVGNISRKASILSLQQW